MKKYFLVLGACLSVLTFSACDSEEAQRFDFDKTAFLPKTATNVEVFKLDIDGDGELEAALYYKNHDQLDVEVFANQEHIEIYKDVNDNGWELMFEKIYPSESLNSRLNAYNIVSSEIVDVAGDGKDELLVTYNIGNQNSKFINDYDLFCIQNGSIVDVTFSKTYTREGEPTEVVYGHLISVDVVDGEIIQKFGGLCEGGVTPCYTYELVVSYNHETGEWSLSESQNKKKINKEWEAYQEKYSDALQWTDELPF